LPGHRIWLVRAYQPARCYSLPLGIRPQETSLRHTIIKLRSLSSTHLCFGLFISIAAQQRLMRNLHSPFVHDVIHPAFARSRGHRLLLAFWFPTTHCTIASQNASILTSLNHVFLGWYSSRSWEKGSGYRIHGAHRHVYYAHDIRTRLPCSVPPGMGCTANRPDPTEESSDRAPDYSSTIS